MNKKYCVVLRDCEGLQGRFCPCPESKEEEKAEVRCKWFNDENDMVKLGWEWYNKYGDVYRVDFYYHRKSTDSMWEYYPITIDSIRLNKKYISQEKYRELNKGRGDNG